MIEARRYRRSPHLVITWHGSTSVLLNAETSSEFVIQGKLVDLLARLGEWSTADGLAAAGISVNEAELDQLHQLGILDRDRAEESAHLWETLELAVHRRTARVGTPTTTGTGSHRCCETSLQTLVLPTPTSLDITLDRVLLARRTSRQYDERALTLLELSTLLHHAAGVTGVDDPTGPRRRPFASAGARGELEIYVVCNNVKEMAPGAWAYTPETHQLQLIRRRDDSQTRLCTATNQATGLQLNLDPAVILVITAVVERMTSKYGHLSLSLIYKNVGCLLQTLYLVAAALDLAPCAIGGGDELDTARWLGIEPLVEPQVGCFLVGPGVPA